MYLLQLWTAGLNGDVSARYEQEFHDKLMKWVDDNGRPCFDGEEAVTIRDRFSAADATI